MSGEAGRADMDEFPRRGLANLGGHGFASMLEMPHNRMCVVEEAGLTDSGSREVTPGSIQAEGIQQAVTERERDARG